MKRMITEDDIDTLVREAKLAAKLEMLNWVMQVCGTSPGVFNVAHLRKIVYNKFIELSGKGERA